MRHTDSEKNAMHGMEWRKVGDYEWWLVFTDAPENLREPDERGVSWPPSMVISWAGVPGACCHLHSYSNGDMPGDKEADPDYLHICNVDDLIAELQAFKAAAGWQPADWEKD